jgi:hypothetical protein
MNPKTKKALVIIAGLTVAGASIAVMVSQGKSVPVVLSADPGGPSIT